MQDVIKGKSDAVCTNGRPYARYKFNEKIATKVFRFAKDKTQAYLKTANISQYKDEFFLKLQKDYSDTFLDGTKVANSNHKPIITRYPHSIPRNGKTFDVIVINNALSQGTVKYLFQQFNNISFMSGKGKKEKCFVRVSSLTDSPFVMSNGETIYKSCSFNEVDYKLLSIFNNIKRTQEDAVIQARGGEEYKPTLICTDIYTITGHSKNCKFSHHSDYSTMHTSASSNECDRIYSGHENGYLPTQDEMQVVTLILSNSQQSESSRLVYKDKHKTGKLCKENILLGNNTIHIQGPGSQSNGITHQSEMIEGADSVPGTFRIIVTFRSSVPRNSKFFPDRFESHTGNPNAHRSVHWQYKYQHQNVIDKLVRAAQPKSANLRKETFSDDESEPADNRSQNSLTDDNVLNEMSINLASHINKDTYTKISPNEYKKLNIVRPPPVGTFNATVFEVAKDPYFVKLLFRKGYLVRYVTYYNDDNTLSETIASSSYFMERDAIPMVPMPPVTPGVTNDNDRKKHYQFYKPGQHYTTSMVMQMLSLHSTDQQTPFFNPSNTRTPGICTSKPYKNSMENHAMVTQQQLNDIANNKTDKLYTSKCNGVQVVNGSGGEPTRLGEHAPAPNHDNKGDAYVQIPLHQESCGPTTFPRPRCANIGLREQFSVDRRIFLYFWDEWKLFGQDPFTKPLLSLEAINDAKLHNGKSTICRFVDTMYCTSFAQAQDDAFSVYNEYKNFGYDVRKHITFRTNQHIKMVCTPFFTDTDYQLIAEREKSDYQYKTLVFESTTRDGVYFNLPFGNTDDLFLLHEKTDNNENNNDDEGVLQSSTKKQPRVLGSFSRMSLLRMVANQDRLLHKYLYRMDNNTKDYHKEDKQHINNTDSSAADGDDSYSLHNVTESQMSKASQDSVQKEYASNNSHATNNCASDNTNNNASFYKSDSVASKLFDDSTDSESLPTNFTSNKSQGTLKRKCVGNTIDSVKLMASKIDDHCTDNSMDEYTQYDRDNDEGSNSEDSTISKNDGYESDESFEDINNNDADTLDPEIIHTVKEVIINTRTMDPKSVTDFETGLLKDFDSTIGNSMRLCNRSDGRGTTISIDEIVKGAIFVNAAGAYRYLKKGGCLVEKPILGKDTTNGEKKRKTITTAEFSSPLMVESLGVALRVNSHPMSNRSLDAVPLAIRREAKRMGWIPKGKIIGNLVLSKVADRNILGDALFAITALRFTGRVSRFALYSSFKNNTKKEFLPKGDENLETFIQFVKSTTKKNPNKKSIQSMSPWLSRQHVESIPKHIRKSHACYASFLRKMATNKKKIVQTLIQILPTEKNANIESRHAAIQEIKSFLEACCGNTLTGNIEFMTHQIVADLENIFGLLFGEVTAASVQGGHAGLLGYTAIVWRQNGKEKQSFAAILDKIVHRVNDGTLGNKELAIAGFHRDKNGKVRNIVNGLLFSPTDAEHWLCKGWIMVKKTFNHYRNSRYPKPLEPHLHPIRYPRVNLHRSIISDVEIDNVMSNITKNYELETNKGSLRLPHIFKVEGTEGNRST